MGKKKKTQLKPVARGFATTSVPKKLDPEEEAAPEDASTPLLDVKDPIQESGPSRPTDGATTATPAPADDFDPDKAEEQSLQNLVDKFQEKVEKEIVRAVKLVESERRLAKSLPSLELDESYIRQIISLAMETLEVQGIRPCLEGPEEKHISKLGVTYGILRRLGFSEDRTVECLKAVEGIELEEAYEWLHLHCSEEELAPLEPVQADDKPEPQTPSKPRHSRKDAPKDAPITPKTPKQFLAPLTPSTTKPTFRLDAGASAFVPRSAQPSASSSSVPASSEASDSDDSDDPNITYSKLMARVDRLTTFRQKSDTTDASVISQLKVHIKAAQDHYFFDQKEANRLYAQEKSKAQQEAMEGRLRGNIVLQQPPKFGRGKAVAKETTDSPASKSVASSEASTDLFEFDSDGVGMLELLQAPQEEVTAEGTVIEVRDFSQPKHRSGKQPKALLQETVQKVDRYAIISYAVISGGSRAKRASVTICWEGKKTEDWRMDNIACYEESQAEQYISTVALHSLAYPRTDGFAAVSSGNHTYFRLLPPPFRDLWDELETVRKATDDGVNRAVWAKLREVIEPKLILDPVAQSKTLKAVGSAKEHALHGHVAQANDHASTELMVEFQARCSSSAYQEMLFQRDQLPIAPHRQSITDCLLDSQVVVLSGETGCGKSTQVPAFILEDQLSRGKACRIFCTEPRRISAISLAQRVSKELGDAPNALGTMSSLVGYAIRLESNTSKNTRLTYVTNGIALRMLEGGSGHGGQGTAFDDITHIIIDEVHERSIESDFLLIVLKSLLEQRRDLRVILMSATVDAEKISAFFGGCPMLHIPGRTFPVDTRYLEDAVELTNWSISENSPFARRSHDKFYKKRTDWSEDVTGTADDEDDQPDAAPVKLEKRYSAHTTTTINLLDERLIPYDLIIRLLERICLDRSEYTAYSAAILIFMPGLAEIRRLTDVLGDHPVFGSEAEFKIHPLHSTISSEAQSAVFDVPPYGIRKIVIATNIAETGITIPDITCVIDTGKHKEMRFDEKRQISRLIETFIAKSNAAQRRGRAGRVQKGLCFHLFTKLRHDTQMADHPLPEMMRLSLSDLALRIKIMKVNLGSSIEDVLSKALDPPISINVQRAVSMLVEVRALTAGEEITPMGRLLSKLPTDVHLGKFLLYAALFRCLDPALTVAAALNSKSPFVAPFGMEHEADLAKNTFRVENSDFLTIHNAFASWRKASNNGVSFVRKFCRANFLSHQNLQQIEELRQQFLSYLVDASFIHVDKSFIRELSRARYSRNKTRFIPVPAHLDVNALNVAHMNAALVAGLYPKVLTVDLEKRQMRTISNNQAAFFHPSSINFGRKPHELGAHHLAYFTLMHSKKLYVWETAPVEDLAMVLLCGDVDVKLIANYLSLDRNKVRHQVSPKLNIALKHLRHHLSQVLALEFKGKPLQETGVLWKQLAMDILGKVKVVEEGGAEASLQIVLPPR